jgi:hypothetical protein
MCDCQIATISPEPKSYVRKTLSSPQPETPSSYPHNYRRLQQLSFSKSLPSSDDNGNKENLLTDFPSSKISPLSLNSQMEHIEESSDEEYFPTEEEPDQDMDTEDEEEEEDNDYREYLDPEDETDRDEQADVERILLQSNPGLLRQIQRVLQHGIGIRSNTQSYEERQNRRTRRRLQEIPTVPYPAGKCLLNSGEFGEIDDRRAKKRRYEKARTIMQLARFREMGWRKESTLPLSKAWLPPPNQGSIVAQYDRHVYSGQFSHDGSFFYTASQDFKCRMYQTLNPSNVQDWKLYKV